METQVLIVGAGPTGLMMACQLQRFGIDFIIIDKKPGTTDQSKALAVQSRSLEIYEQMGIADKAIEQGQKAMSVNVVVKGDIKGRISLGDIGEKISPFPFMHILEQSKNEKIMDEYLIEHDIKVRWEHELINLVDDGSKITATIKNNEGKEEIITSEWMVAADGGKSPVRHILNIPFEGDTYENVFFVADTHIDWDFAYNELYISLSRKTLNAFFPMKGDKRFRIVGMLPPKYQSDENLKFEDIKEDIIKNIDIKLDFFNTNWFAVYRLHHRCVNDFKKGRCFLAGDAAHIHSPAGGQGMNTGLQDAYNLAWKLNLVIKKQAKENLLNTYNEERLPNAKILVETTDRVFSLGISKNPFVRFLRLNIFPLLVSHIVKQNTMRKFIYKTISQVRINYFNSSVSKGELNEIKAGLRFPYFHLFDSSKNDFFSIFDLFKTNKFTVLMFSTNPDQQLIQKLKSKIINPELFNFVEIENSSKNSRVIEHEGFGQEFFCIVRPDTYIGYIDRNIDINKINRYIKENLRMI